MKYFTITLLLCAIICMASCSSETPGRVAVLKEDMVALTKTVDALAPRLDAAEATIATQQTTITQLTQAIQGLAIREAVASLEDVKAKNMTDQQLALLLRTDRGAEATKELQKRAKANK